MLLLGPWFTIGLLVLEKTVRQTGVDQEVNARLVELCHWGLVCGLILFAEGLGLHYVANILNGIFGTGPTSLPYYYDEVLGHWLPYLSMLVGLFFLMGTQLLFPQQEPLPRGPQLVLAFFSIPLGIYLAYSAIERQTPLLALISTPLLAAVLFIFVWRQRRKLANYPICFFALMVLSVTFVTTVCYGFVFCGWPQPSELVGG